MAKQSPILYSVSKTFVWFAIVSLILLAGLLAIVFLDYDREWKHWQKKFIELKVQKTKEELQKTDQAIDKKRLETLTKELTAAQASAKAHRADVEKVRQEIDALDSKIVRTRTGYQDLKQYQSSYKYFIEEYAQTKDPRADDVLKKLAELEPKIMEVKNELDDLEKQKELKEMAAQEFSAKEKSVQKEIDKILEEKTRMEGKLKKITPTLAKDILNAPMLDFIAPSLQIQQVVLENLQDDYHFARVQKVDRCTTCHLGIDQKGFENVPQPFRTHPNLDLYLGSASPHPFEKFGCTVCHGGNGHSVSFKDSAHMPQNETQKKEWRKKYHWQMLEKWDNKMLPLNHIEAACAKCHTQVTEVPRAEKLNKGRKLAQTSGCFNCHKVEGFENAWKVGPSLEHIQSKTSSDWMVRWLDKPKDFRSSTQMPQIFNLSNTSSPEDLEKNKAVIQSIVAYLNKNSEAVKLTKPPVPGDRQRGETLVKTLGCLGCHSVAGVQSNDFGPELSNLGTKTTPEWVYTWIKNPESISKNTRMPNLRVSDQDAADITSYLISQTNPAFDQKPVTPVNPKVVDKMVLSYLESTLRKAEAQQELSKMTLEDKQQFLGKKSIAFQGCFSCHDIRGFEDAKPIGTELSTEGSKDIHQLDFGFIPLEKTRHDWIAQKLKDPRIFDQGRLKDYHEKLRMPLFGFTDEEIDALNTFVLSLTEQKISLEMQKRLDSKNERIEKGRRLVAKYNCAGCHSLDGKTGTLRELTEDKGQAPPILDGEGAKTQEKWLHEFLRSPGTIRPWLTTHMPTFKFTEGELTDLVHYFAAESGQEVSYRGIELPKTTPEKLATGKILFEKFQCTKCHQVNATALAMGASFLAPDLTLSKQRLKPKWVVEWLKDPQKLQPDTMMPTFFPDGQTPLPDILDGDTQQQIEAIRDYLYTYEGDTASSDLNPVAKSSSNG